METPKKDNLKGQDAKQPDALVLRQSEDVIAMAQKKLSRQYIKFIATAALFAAIISAAIYFINGEVKQIKAVKSEERWATDGLNAVASLGAESDKAEKIIGEVENRFPSDIEVPIKIIPAVKQYAAASGIIREPEIEVRGLGAAAGGAPGVSFEMKIDAPLMILINFLGLFEKNYLVRVSTWQLQPLGQGPDAYHMVVDGTFFIR